jgi:hypothetical protein
MQLLYVDESGTSEITGNTSHFILAGISVPIEYWKIFDKEIEFIKSKYGLADKEMHVAWMMRPYLEQTKIPNFDKLNYGQRQAAITRWRTIELLRLQKLKDKSQYRQTKKNFTKTIDYIHLTYEDRKRFIEEVARHVAQWGYTRLFAECIDKTYFDPSISGGSIDEQAFEQVISRFEHYLQIVGQGKPNFGLIIHDNNETIAKKHTALMRKFHLAGTQWMKVSNIIETPLFVDSQLTSMVQIADLCGYAIRRYLENGDNLLFDLVFQRADKKGNVVVGVRHWTLPSCNCKICAQHKVDAALVVNK